jgi:transposase
MSISGRPSRVTEEQYRRIMAVKEARAGIPSDKALGREFGLSTATIRSIMNRGLKRYRRA